MEFCGDAKMATVFNVSVPLDLANFMREKKLNPSKTFQAAIYKLIEEETEKKNIHNVLQEENNELTRKIEKFVSYLESTSDRTEDYQNWYEEQVKKEKEKMPYENVKIKEGENLNGSNPN